jgi:hypothetical protein
MKRIARRAAAAFVPLLLSFSPEALSQPAPAPRTPATIAASRAFVLPNCPIAQQITGSPASPAEGWQGSASAESALAGLAVGLAEPLVSLAGDLIAEWLRARAAERSLRHSWLATGEFPLGARDQPVLPCLVLVKGDFVPRPAVVADDMRGGAPADLQGWDWPPHWLAAFQLATAPDIYVEVAMRVSQAQDAVRFEPLFLDFRRGGVSAAPQHLAMTVEARIGAGALGATAIALPSPLRPGSRLLAAHLIGVSSPWVPLPRAETAGRSPSLPAGALTVQANLVASEQPTGIELLLSRVFAAARAPVQQAIIRQVQPGPASAGNTEPAIPHGTR